MSESTAHLNDALGRFHRGEKSARDELIGLAYERLRVLASRMLNNYQRLRRQGEETGDVLHMSMIRLMRALDEVKPPTLKQFFGLSAVQIRRELLDLSRHHFGRAGFAERPRKTAGDTVLGEMNERQPTSPERRVAWAELHEIVDTLPEKLREVVDLLLYFDLTQDEASKILEVDKSTVKRRWREARLQLEQVLGDWRSEA